MDGEGILIIPITNLSADILGIRTTVDETLSVMHVAVLPGAARGGGVSDVGDVYEDDSGAAGGVTGESADGENEVALVVGEDVVCSADGEFVVMTC